MQVTEADYLTASYRFELPAGLIAQQPSPRRGESRLYLLDRAHPERDRLCSFADLAGLLPPRSLLVANNVKVVPARLWGRRPGGGVLEVFLLRPLPLLEEEASAAKNGWLEAEAEVLIRPAGRVKIGVRYALGEGLAVTVSAKKDFGEARAMLFWQGSLKQRLRSLGVMPLPPYIRRAPGAEDLERYQTFYADENKAGAVAAPTAGLHFTPDIRAELLRAGHEWAELTLFTGYGTFSPVRTKDIRLHRLHPEYAELPEETVRGVLRAREEGRAVLAVGTTSARTLEGVAAMPAKSGDGRLLRPYRGWLDYFIYPGKPVRVLDGLITNFHLPESSLLMLAAALAGRERLLAAYARAVSSGFNFFSYGDAMLIV